MAQGYVNPARAGMIRSVASWKVTSRSKPRASGDDPTSQTEIDRYAL